MATPCGIYWWGTTTGPAAHNATLRMLGTHFFLHVDLVR